MIFDYRQADLQVAERALCDYAVKLTLQPAEMKADDVERLRGFGFTDEQISLATQVIGYFNYINRIADGLGVDAETWMTVPSLRQWHEQRGRDYLADQE